MLKKSKIKYFDSITSTNDYLKENYITLENGTIITSKVQTKGRGRFGRNWISQEGGLWFSILIKKNFKDPNFYTKLSSLCILKILKKIGISAKIKWPNDIYVGNKKLSGILTEIITKNNEIKGIIIGIGLNVNNETPKEGVSISKILNKKMDIQYILEDFIKTFNKLNILYRLFPFLLTNSWKKNLKFKENDLINGYKIKKITSDFLILEKDSKEKKVFSIHELDGGN